MTRFSAVGWNVLAIALLVGFSAPQLRAEEPEATRTSESETTGTTVKTDDGRTWQRSTVGTVTGAQGGEHDYSVERTGSVVHAEDGSTTRDASKTYTNGQGEQVNVVKSGTSTKNDDGSVSYQGTRTVTNPNGESRTYDTTGTRTVTKAEDGSTTREASRTTTNAETGHSRTVESSGQVTPTENGKTWTNDRKVENSAGGSHSSHTEGQATRNGDGTGSASSHTDRQGTTAKGKSWSGATDRNSSRAHSNGSVTTQRSTTHTGSHHGGGHHH